MLCLRFLLLVSSVSGSVHFLKRYEFVSPTLRSAPNGAFVMSFDAFDRQFEVKLESSTAPLFRDFRLITQQGQEVQMDLFKSTRFYTAKLVGAVFSYGFVTMGTGPGNVYGRIETVDDNIILEPAENNLTMVYWVSHPVCLQSFQESDMDLAGLRNVSASRALLPTSLLVSPVPESYFERFRVKRDTVPVKKNRCEIKLVADYAFFKLIGHGNYANAARYLVNLIERINQIFRPVDWGFTANDERLINLGFTIKEMKIFDRPSERVAHFNSDYQFGKRYVSAMDMLHSFSRVEGSSGACLSILISGKVFDMSILGLANIGGKMENQRIVGVCARDPLGDQFKNTAVISVQRRSGLMITRVVDLVVAHEIGHTWGGLHDDVNNPNCMPAEPRQGRYIMHESSNTGYDPNNYKFSPCSISAIHKVLYNVVDKCFVEEQQSLCGNGILESGEKCDPGGQLLLGHTHGHDPCCTSKCKFRGGAVCSPKHSECCSAKCGYLPSTHMCQALNNDTCKKAVYCSGDSEKCGRPEPVPDDTECADEGQCRNGECISFCHLVSVLLSPCICEKVDESCLRCCRSPQGICMPVKPYRYLQEGSICIHGHCKKNVCVKEVTDAVAHFWRILKDFRDNPTPKHFADYIVFIVIVVSLLVWCPCGAFIVYRVSFSNKNSLFKGSNATQSSGRR